MPLYFFGIGLLLTLIISGSWCAHTQQIIVSSYQSFSFDCIQDDSVYFGRQLNDWLEIQENDETYLSLNLKFIYLIQENILRISSESAGSEHSGYYGCRKSTRKILPMARIYHLIIAGK
jgi:hypothetical protein